MMATTRFTPGPCSVYESKNECPGLVLVLDQNGKEIGSVCGENVDWNRDVANAHLWAAAPDLYALAVLGGRVRAAQTSYFKNRTQANLDAARALEAEYDRLAALVTAKARGEETMTQASLIGGE